MPVKGKDYVNQLQVQSEDYHLKWNIKGFKDIPFMADHFITSSTFTFGERKEASWQILFSKGMKSKTDKDESWRKGSKKEDSEKNKERAIGFRMTKVDDSSLWEAITFHVQMQAGNVIAKTAEIAECGNSYFESERFTYIFESDVEGDLFKEDNVLVEAFIKYKYIEPFPLLMADLEKQKLFGEGFTNLYNSQKYADVILKAGDAEIVAHKSVVSARAFCLDVHLQEDPDYKKQTLKIDLDDEVAKAMLCFIYCGGLPSEFPLEKCPALCVAAEKYRVMGLKELLSKYFKDRVQLDVCMDCLELSDTEDIMSMFLRLAQEKIKAASEKCLHKQRIPCIKIEKY